MNKSKIRNIKLFVFDFDGVFTDNCVYVTQDGIEMVKSSRYEGFGLRAINKLGIETLVLSTEVNPVVTVRCNKLGIKCVQSIENKLVKLKEILLQRNLSPEFVGYMGNDINDLECMKYVGLSVCPRDSHKTIKRISDYITKANGGNGAVREICDLIVRSFD